MIEALACGTPVIAFRGGSVEEIIEDGVTGFIVNEEEGGPALGRAAIASSSDQHASAATND
jgi:glycosyltransferase involved in cell wall biosynthesis